MLPQQLSNTKYHSQAVLENSHFTFSPVSLFSFLPWSWRHTTAQERLKYSSDKAAQPALSLRGTYSTLRCFHYSFLISSRGKSLHNHKRWRWSTPLWHFLDFALLTSTCFCTPVPQASCEIWKQSSCSVLTPAVLQTAPNPWCNLSFESPWDIHQTKRHHLEWV